LPQSFTKIGRFSLGIVVNIVFSSKTPKSEMLQDQRVLVVRWYYDKLTSELSNDGLKMLITVTGFDEKKVVL
jgi:hypothetical protein